MPRQHSHSLYETSCRFKHQDLFKNGKVKKFPDVHPMRLSSFIEQFFLDVHGVVDMLHSFGAEVGPKIAQQLLSNANPVLHPPITINVLSWMSTSVAKSFMDKLQTFLGCGLAEYPGYEPVDGCAVVGVPQTMKNGE